MDHISEPKIFPKCRSACSLRDKYKRRGICLGLILFPCDSKPCIDSFKYKLEMLSNSFQLLNISKVTHTPMNSYSYSFTFLVIKWEWRDSFHSCAIFMRHLQMQSIRSEVSPWSLKKLVLWRKSATCPTWWLRTISCPSPTSLSVSIVFGVCCCFSCLSWPHLQWKDCRIRN